MATQWPQASTWPTPIREHATRLSTYLQETLTCIERTNNQPVPADLVKTIIHGTVTFILKTQHAPDFSTVCDAMRMAQTEAKAAAESTTQALSEIRNELKNTAEAARQSTTIVQQTFSMGEEARAAAREAATVGKAAMEMTREIKIKGLQNQTGGPATYAAMAARGSMPASIQNTQSPRTPSVQTQREAVVNIRNALTIQSLRAMNPRNLKAHVERALEQSENRNLANVKIVSSNQLKSGDLSIKTASSNEVEALKQFAEDWAHRIGNGATVQIPTYGVLAHGIRTSTLDTDKFDENKNQILQDNRPFIPQAEIKYIGWLSRAAQTKSASTIIIEFTKPEDANKIIDEGLVWQGEVFQCERYERQCRLRQCFKCQEYGHIGTQCKAITACGYCAQEHNSRDCQSKTDRNAPRKCAKCRGEHEAWSRQCPARKEEMAKIKVAYAIRPQYHHVPETRGGNTQPSGTPEALLRHGPGPSQAQESQAARTRSQSRRGQKRTSTETTANTGDQENQSAIEVGSQRPQRAIMPSRRALEAIENNTQLTRMGSQQMDIDQDTEA